MRVNLRICVAVLVLATAIVAPSFGAEGQAGSALPRKHTFGMAAAEAGGSLAGAIAGGVALGAGAFFLTRAITGDDPQQNTPGQAMVFAAWAGYPVGAALGVTLAGSLVRDDGRFVPSLIWAGAASALAAGIFLGSVALYDTNPGFRKSASDVTGALCFFVEGLGVPVAACIGYATGRPKLALSGRVLPGGLAFRHDLTPDGARYTACDLRLVNVRF